MWLHPEDMSQLVNKSLETDCPFGIFYVFWRRKSTLIHGFARLLREPLW